MTDPTPEEMAAIVAAVQLCWPEPPPTPAPSPDDRPNRWRFSGRWWSRPAPTRRDRLWGR